MGKPIDQITINGFKSIRALEDFKLGKLNVLIGSNGAGKSNFVDYFRMLRAMADECFQEFVLQAGGGDSFFFLGPQKTKSINSRVVFGDNSYEHLLKPSANGSIIFSSETTGYSGSTSTYPPNSESVLKSIKDERSKNFPSYHGVGHYIYESISSWTVYHFHDTSSTAPMRRNQPVHDYYTLRDDASNIAAFLYNLKNEEKSSYELIRNTIRLIAPYFNRFILRPKTKGKADLIRLEWRQKGSSFPFQPDQLSDGTMRFICLATALLQPDPPATIVIDEPELGLHPYAISMLAELISSASERTQVIISTQSPALLDYFDSGDIIVVNRHNKSSTFSRLDSNSLGSWLEEYSLGELWQKNVVKGGPAGE